MTQNTTATSLQEVNDMLIPVGKLSKDLLNAGTLNKQQARFTVDLYYQLQEMRIRAQGQIRALIQGADDAPERPAILDFFFTQFTVLEDQMKKALHNYAKQSLVGEWALSVVGIGPVLTAGLLANIDIHRARYAGQIWSFAGLTSKEWLGKERAAKTLATLKAEHSTPLEALSDYILMTGKSPQSIAYTLGGETLSREESLVWIEENAAELTWQWMQKQAEKRPWSTRFKSLCAYKIGESFVKVQANKKDYYGHIFAAKKQQYNEQNANGRFEEFAAEALKKKTYNKSTDAYKAYSAGRFPPAHIHAMARRWTVKLFISHFHQVMSEVTHRKPAPRPWIIEIGGHKDYVPAPNWILGAGEEGKQQGAMNDRFDIEGALDTLSLTHYWKRADEARALRKEKQNNGDFDVDGDEMEDGTDE